MRPGTSPSACRTRPYTPPRTKSPRASTSTARTNAPSRTAASRNHGAVGPIAASAMPDAKNATDPSPATASVAARHVGVNASSVLVARTTRTRSADIAEDYISVLCTFVEGDDLDRGVAHRPEEAIDGRSAPQDLPS